MTTNGRSHPADLTPHFQLGGPADARRAFDALQARHRAHNHRYLGFPVASDDFSITWELDQDVFYNNIGRVGHPHPGYQHAMEAEAAVLEWFADLFRIPAGWWGHVTTGGSAGNMAGIRYGRELFPDAILLHSQSAHYSVSGVAADLRIPTQTVPSLPGEQMDLRALDAMVGRLAAERPLGDRSLIVVATLGTTRTEACDDLAGIQAILDRHRISRRYLHVDGALAGIPLACDGRFTMDGADSVAVSGYKFLGVPTACGIVLGRRTGPDTTRAIPYIGTVGITGVRDGRPALMMYESLSRHGVAGHRARAHRGRQLADQLIAGLHRLGIIAWRHPGAYFTVVMENLPEAIHESWYLGPNGDGRYRAILVPGRRREHVAAFLGDLDALTAGRESTPEPRTNLFATFTPGQVTG